MAQKIRDLSGKRFGKWTVLHRDGKILPVRWICKCDCGTIRSVSRASLCGGSSSCGLCAEARGKDPRLLRRHSNRLYHTWSEMRRRCNGSGSNKKYYSGKGIRYYGAWDDFDLFAKWAIESGYAPGLEIDRIDSDADYTPDNCRWVTHKVNSRNRKARSNSKTGVAGVTTRARKDGSIAYRVTIKTDAGNKHLGTYDSLERAADVRKEAELKYWGFSIGG